MEQIELSMPVVIAIAMVIGAVLIALVFFLEGRGSSQFQSAGELFGSLFTSTPPGLDLCLKYNGTGVSRENLADVIGAVLDGKCQASMIFPEVRFTEADLASSLEELGIVDAAGNALYIQRQTCDAPSPGAVMVAWPAAGKWFEQGSAVNISAMRGSALLCPSA